MRLTIIGCSGSVPGPDSPASCYLVEADGYSLVLDLGSGSFGPLQRHVRLGEIGAVLFSHLHADHCMDLCALPVASKYGPYGRADALPVLGPADLVDRARMINNVRTEDDERELHEMFAFGTVTEGTWALGPLAVTARRVDHPVEAYAYRIEHGGRSLLYSGDSAPCAALDDLASGVDLALVEAAYVERRPSSDPDASGVHLTATEAGELAQRAGVRRLVTTHVPPWRDPEEQAAAARAVCDCQVDAAHSGAVYDV
jgi:ribonuclease BN (tRNA processing enzyme)